MEIEPDEVEVGIRGQRITVAGIRQPADGRTYPDQHVIVLSLPRARELQRLLHVMIPLAEEGGPAAEIVAVSQAAER